MKVTWSALNPTSMPESLIEYTKNVSYEFFIIFHILNYVSRCGNIPKFWFKAPELSLFIYLFIHLWNIGNTVYDPLLRIRSSHSQVLKKQQLMHFFSKFTKKHQCRNLILTKFHISSLQFYSKRDSNTNVLVSFSKFFGTTTFNKISGWLLLVPCKFANKLAVANKDF